MGVIARLMGLRIVAPRALQERLRDGGVTVFDVNDVARWREARVPGARHLNPASFGADQLPADRDEALVFYCSNPLCRKAPNAARRAEHLGWRNVSVMEAGIRGWIGASLPVESGEPRT